VLQGDLEAPLLAQHLPTALNDDDGTVFRRFARMRATAGKTTWPRGLAPYPWPLPEFRICAATA